MIKPSICFFHVSSSSSSYVFEYLLYTVQKSGGGNEYPRLQNQTLVVPISSITHLRVIVVQFAGLGQ